MKKFSKSKANNQGGITLVALIITVIVMLILVGVTITTVIDSNLIGSAKNAGEKYQEAQIEENSLNGITIGGVPVNDYIANMNKITFYISMNLEDGPGTVEYTVNKGTTWREFINEENPSDVGGVLFTDDSRNILTSDGFLLVAGGFKVFESTTTWDTGPYVLPDDEIKAGVTYMCER